MPAKSPYNESRKWFRRELLKAIRAEKRRHWQMRGSHRLGKHFERGFFRGLNHADQIVRAVMNPQGRLGKYWRAMVEKQEAAMPNRPTE